MSTQKTAILIILALYAIPSYAAEHYAIRDSTDGVKYADTDNVAKEICTYNPSNSSCTNCVLPSGQYKDDIGEFTEDCKGSEYKDFTQSNILDYRTCTGDCGSKFDRGDGKCETACPTGRQYVEDGVCVPQCSGQRPYIDNGTCMDSCPGERQYNYEKACVDACPSNYFGIGTDKECVDISSAHKGKDYAYNFSATAAPTDSGLSTAGDWSVIYTSKIGDSVLGVVKGVASCNETARGRGATISAAFETSYTGENCWCKTTSPESPIWVSAAPAGSINCSAGCATLCTGLVGDIISCYMLGSDICAAPSFNGTGSSYKNSDGTGPATDLGNSQWTVTFTYGTVEGEAACSTIEGKPYEEVKDSLTDTDVRNGTACWCKMTTPKTSKWALALTGYDSDSDECDSNCAGACANAVRYESTFRKTIYGNVLSK